MDNQERKQKIQEWLETLKSAEYFPSYISDTPERMFITSVYQDEIDKTDEKGADMTKKDFAIIAGIIQNMYLAWQDNATPEIWPDYVARRFAAEFAKDYPNFDHPAFLAACGVAA